MSSEIATLQLSDFEPLVDSSFTLSLEGVEGTAEAVLSEAKVSPAGKYAQEARDPFVLLFRLPQELKLEQSLYQMENDKLGKIALFLVPVKNDETGHYLEAIFS